jgi:tetratricopeptide (TPR) repeat protein
VAASSRPASTQNTKIETQPRPQTPRTSPNTGGLSGMSTQYDDLHCRRIQTSFGLAIPDGATVIEVDGDRLPLADVQELQSGIAPVLFLPKGDHAVQFAPNERAIEITIADHLGATYEDMRRYFGLPGAVRSDELFSRGARAMDVHQAPFLLNFMGGSYASQGQWGAAERKFRRSLRVNPAFAPAHLNLAHCLLRRQDREGAIRELRLAEAFNVSNVFGLNAPIIALRRQLELRLDDRQPVAIRAELYIAAEPLATEDERMIALMEALSKYAVREEDRGKVLNNLAVHFSDSDKPETALEFFRKSLAALKDAGPERFALAKKVLSHMEAACRKAGFEEADEYNRMQAAVRP